MSKIPQKAIEAAQITMGRGLVDVTRIDHEGKSGILLRPRSTEISVGSPGELQAGEYWPVKGDVVIWIENDAGARVLIENFSQFTADADRAQGAEVEPVATVAKLGAGGMNVLVPHPPGSTSHLPIGTLLYTTPPAPQPTEREKVLEEALRDLVSWFSGRSVFHQSLVDKARAALAEGEA